MSVQPEQPPVLTPTALERLKLELEELKTEGRRTVAERLQRARELGDISENAEYEATKDEQAHLEGRIRRLEWLVKHAVVQELPAHSDIIGPGMVVTLRPAGSDDEDEEYLFAASKEERSKGRVTITPSAPLGATLQGKRVGETVSYEAPGGQFSYRVVSISPWDGA
jgi:transcription elongation factor GreA